MPNMLSTLSDEVKRGPITSLGAPLPTPNLPAPAPAATNINQAIKNIYDAAEPWVRYGFEVATYAVGWVPYVGWLSPQIMIFYNFGERIVRSITFNLDDWIFGPLPFGQGLGNVARDSWNALVQLGRDQLNFWLPPLPFAVQAPTAPTVDALAVKQQPGQALAPLRWLSARLQRQDLSTRAQAGARADLPSDPATVVERALHDVAAKVASPLAPVLEAARDRARLIPTKPSVRTATTPTSNGALVRKLSNGIPKRATATAGKGPATVSSALRNKVADTDSRLSGRVNNDARARSHAPKPRPAVSEHRGKRDEKSSH